LAFSEVLTPHATADSGYLGKAARNHQRDIILLLAAAELLNGFEKLVECYAAECGTGGSGFSLRRMTSIPCFRGDWIKHALTRSAVRQRANSRQYLANSLAAIL
jgi:hypothetical protein